MSKIPSSIHSRSTVPSIIIIVIVIGHFILIKNWLVTFMKSWFSNYAENNESLYSMNFIQNKILCGTRTNSSINKLDLIKLWDHIVCNEYGQSVSEQKLFTLEDLVSFAPALWRVGWNGRLDSLYMFLTQG